MISVCALLVCNKGIELNDVTKLSNVGRMLVNAFPVVVKETLSIAAFRAVTFGTLFLVGPGNTSFSCHI